MFSSDYPFESHYIDVKGRKIHYIEEGSGQTFLFIHGNPTSSYLWRNVIAPMQGEAHCVALDLLGHGKSEKPPAAEFDYRFLSHYKYLEGFIEAKGLKNVILVIHDWGGPLGFNYALHHEHNVKGIVFMETFPFTYDWNYFPLQGRYVFKGFRSGLSGKLMAMRLNMFLNMIVPMSIARKPAKATLQHYKDQFPTVESRYPVWMWPNELPITDRQGAAFKAIKKIEDYMGQFQIPMLMLEFSPGAVMRGEKLEWLKQTVTDLTSKHLGKGIHYVQEDNPEGIAEASLEWAKTKGLM